MTLMELPFQNLLRINEKVEKLRLIWIGRDVVDYQHFEKDSRKNIAPIKNESCKIENTDSRTEALKLIKSSIKAVLIVTGDLGRDLIEELYNGLDEL